MAYERRVSRALRVIHGQGEGVGDGVVLREVARTKEQPGAEHRQYFSVGLQGRRTVSLVEAARGVRASRPGVRDRIIDGSGRWHYHQSAIPFRCTSARLRPVRHRSGPTIAPACQARTSRCRYCSRRVPNPLRPAAASGPSVHRQHHPFGNAVQPDSSFRCCVHRAGRGPGVRAVKYGGLLRAAVGLQKLSVRHEDALRVADVGPAGRRSVSDPGKRARPRRVSPESARVSRSRYRSYIRHPRRLRSCRQGTRPS